MYRIVLHMHMQYNPSSKVSTWYLLWYAPRHAVLFVARLLMRIYICIYIHIYIDVYIYIHIDCGMCLHACKRPLATGGLGWEGL